jgi:hypothetical protein
VLTKMILQGGESWSVVPIAAGFGGTTHLGPGEPPSWARPACSLVSTATAPIRTARHSRHVVDPQPSAQGYCPIFWTIKALSYVGAEELIPLIRLSPTVELPKNARLRLYSTIISQAPALAFIPLYNSSKSPAAV